MSEQLAEGSELPAAIERLGDWVSATFDHPPALRVRQYGPLTMYEWHPDDPTSMRLDIADEGWWHVFRSGGFEVEMDSDDPEALRLAVESALTFGVVRSVLLPLPLIRTTVVARSDGRHDPVGLRGLWLRRHWHGWGERRSDDEVGADRDWEMSILLDDVAFDLDSITMDDGVFRIRGELDPGQALDLLDAEHAHDRRWRRRRRKEFGKRMTHLTASVTLSIANAVDVVVDDSERMGMLVLDMIRTDVDGVTLTGVIPAEVRVVTVNGPNYPRAEFGQPFLRADER